MFRLFFITPSSGCDSPKKVFYTHLLIQSFLVHRYFILTVDAFCYANFDGGEVFGIFIISVYIKNFSGHSMKMAL